VSSSQLAPVFSSTPTRFFSDQKKGEDLDWEQLLAKFQTDGADDFGDDLDQFGAFNDEDMEQMNDSRFDFDIENPPKLRVSHYNQLKSINPELYEQWVALRTVKWKMEGKLKPLPTLPFKSDDVDAYDNIPMWAKPTARIRKKTCFLCRADTSDNKANQIVFTNLELLHKVLNERGMIIGRRVTGMCGPHQRQTTKAIKRARLTGLLAFTSNWKIPESQLPDHVFANDPLYTAQGDSLPSYESRS
jgi:small subunit ribosomal protein S18